MDCSGKVEMVRVDYYGECQVVNRETVLRDLQYQYEGTEFGVGPENDICYYDIYSNDDGDYFAVKEDE